MSLGVVVVGAGYWGPNLIRNFMKSDDWHLRAVCDANVARAEAVVGRYSTVRAIASFDEVLADGAVDAVAIATPASTHFDLATAALEAGKHVLIEKPIAASVGEAEKLVELAAARGLTLMCDHTFVYTPAVQKIRELVTGGELGEISYVDSVRINLGLIQPDIDVVWDLAPHDLSILDAVLPEHNRPAAVSAFGVDPVGAGRACVAYLTLPLAGGGIAHTHVNWLSPVKIRTMVIGGTKKMLVWDDMSTTQRISLYDKGVDLTATMDPAKRSAALISYRLGEMVAPALTEREALSTMVTEFAVSIRDRRAPLTDGHAGLRVVRALHAASRSLESNGSLIPLEGSS
ncbi:MAG TPA: Gfo/Idh/MocA family oxidoreductase [Jatrophihabitans sp.]|nr:Gfo/Idh/MocA family oxidoreductase [Jatrophihabitans sp.]